MNEPLFNAPTTTGLHFALQTNNSVTQVLKIHHYYLFSKYNILSPSGVESSISNVTS